MATRPEAELERSAPPTPEPQEGIAGAQAALETARALSLQAEEHYERGEYAAAAARLEEALALQEGVLGEDDLAHVDLLKKLAATVQKQGLYSAALPLVQRVADIHLRVLGPAHPMTIMALGDLMSKVSYEYGLGAAMPLQAQMLQAMEETLGSEDPYVLMARQSFEQMQSSLSESSHGAAQPSNASRSERREQALAALPAEHEDLLAGLDDVDWHSLHHASGPADDVPRLLRLLLSDDEAVRDDAWETLYSNVWHQGTVYEASAYVVPFLLRMLGSDGPPGQMSLLHFLSALAQGSSYLAAHARSDEQRDHWQDILARDGRDLETELEQELSWVEATNRAVGEGTPLFLDLARGEDAELQQLALDTLANLRRRSGEIAPRLRELLPEVPQAETRVRIVLALDELMGEDGEAQRFFAGLMQGDEERLVNVVVAGALARRARERTPEAAVAILVDGLREGSTSELSPAYAWERAPFQLTLQALAHLGPERGRDALLKALPTIRDVDNALDLAGTLLDLAFNDGQLQDKATAVSLSGDGASARLEVDYWEPEAQPPRTASSLTAVQVDVLGALLSHDPVWAHEHNLLRLYGLPAEREGLRVFVQESL
jgi:hypothetical protein